MRLAPYLFPSPQRLGPPTLESPEADLVVAWVQAVLDGRVIDSTSKQKVHPNFPSECLSGDVPSDMARFFSNA
jgi:hypothetical protein